MVLLIRILLKMDSSKLNFLQSVLKYSTLNTGDNVKPEDTTEEHAKLTEMDPEVQL